MRHFSIVIFIFLMSLFNRLPAAEYEILGIGAPCMDIILPVEESFLVAIGADKGCGKQVPWETFLKIVTGADVMSPKLSTGGSCSNTIKGLASLDKSSALLGKIGNDFMGQFYLQNIQNTGVIPLLLPSNTPTAQVAVLVTPDAQRTFRCFPGAGNELSAEDLTPEMFAGVKIVHIEGYALYNSADLVEKAMQMAKEAGALVSFDVSSVFVVTTFKEHILHLLGNYVDIVFANEFETLALTGLSPSKGCDFLKNICEVAVVLNGKNGCWVGSGHERYHCPTRRVDVVDTTGAGDLFAAGFLYGCLNGSSLKECAKCGNLLGSSVVEVYGAEIPQEKWVEIRDLIDTLEVFPIIGDEAAEYESI